MTDLCVYLGDVFSVCFNVGEGGLYFDIFGNLFVAFFVVLALFMPMLVFRKLLNFVTVG